MALEKAGTTSRSDAEPAAAGTPDGPHEEAQSPGSPTRFVPAPGSVIGGKYEVADVLGRGGMGVVTHGRQLELDRPVAIKFLRPALAGEARPLQRFTREARAIARMNSEHVVRVIDVGEHEGVPFIVMEHLVGRDLAAILRDGPLSVEESLELLVHACDAIAEAHALGIVHRDIKPSNLFVAEGRSGRRSLKVLDFGISKWLGPAPDFETPLATGDGGLLGTPAYVAPEQLTQPETTDERADVWALGVVLQQCLTGELPFAGDSLPQLCAAILTAKPRTIERSLAVPAGLCDVISRCLAKNRNERYASVIELVRALLPFAPARVTPLGESLLAFAPAVRKATARPEPATRGTANDDSTQTLPSLGLSQEARTPEQGAEERGARLLRTGQMAIGAILLVLVAGAAAFAILAPRPRERAGSDSVGRSTAASPVPPTVGRADALAPEPTARVEVSAIPPLATPPTPSVSASAPGPTRNRPSARPAPRPAPPASAAATASTAPAPPASVAAPPGPNVVPLYRR